MSGIGEKSVTELFAALIAEANRHQSSVAVSGILPLVIGLRKTDHIALGTLQGSRFQAAMQIQVKNGLPMGKYRIGIFIIPEREETIPIIGNA